MKIRWKTQRPLGWRLTGPLVVFVLLFAFLVTGVYKIEQQTPVAAAQILQQSAVRAAVQCYAIEGAYPPDAAYLEENYGLMVDHNRFVVHYEAFASNVLPDIRIVDLKVE